MVTPPNGMPGGIISLSANGAAAGSGIVWVNLPLHDDANQQTVPGMLRAFDATDLRRELWNSEMNPARDRTGLFGKFSPPTIANGRVYLASFSGALQVDGLLP